VDKRADIWAFGVVLYEMLTGGRLFDAETVADVLAAVLDREPDWKPVPGKAQRLLRVCLEKDPKRRLQAIGDARLLLEDTPEVAWPAETRTPQPGRRWLVSALAALLALAGTALALQWGRQGSPTFAGDWQLSLTAPPGSDLADIGSLGSATPEISPDGSMIVARVGDSLSLRRLNSAAWTPLPGTGRCREREADLRSSGPPTARKSHSCRTPSA
jgi:serine/threonine-protein kinase